MAKYRSILAMFIVGLCAWDASAAILSSLTRAQFQAAAGGGAIGSQSFDAIATGTLLSSPLGGVSYGVSAGVPVVTSRFRTSTPPNGLGSTSLGFMGPSEAASFSFSTPISAFAIDVNTFADSRGAYFATLGSGDVAQSLALAFPNATTGQFIGFVSSTPFTDVVIRAATGFSYTLDTLVFGSAGLSPFVPVVPSGPIDSCAVFAGSLCFLNPTPGRWFDPPNADGFAYSLSSGAFTRVGVPDSAFGFGPVKLIVGGVEVATLLPGDTFDFVERGFAAVTDFRIRGISPMLDPASPEFATAFPTFLDFTGSPSTLTMTPILASTAVPAPDTLGLVVTGLLGLGALRRRNFVRIRTG